jgi:lysyl-tRNA synthetase class 1
VSSTDQYTSGNFDEALRQVLRCNQAILDIMLPTLREDGGGHIPGAADLATTGRVLQVPVEVVDADAARFASTMRMAQRWSSPRSGAASCNGRSTGDALVRAGR